MSDSSDLWEQKSTYFGKILLTVKKPWVETQHMVKATHEVQSSNFIYNGTNVILGVRVQIQLHTENCRSNFFMFGT